MRKDGDLLLGGEHDSDPGSPGAGQHVVEPPQRIGAEVRHAQQRGDVAGEAGQAEGIGDGHGDPVPEPVQPGGHLPRCQPGPIGEEDLHGFSL